MINWEKAREYAREIEERIETIHIGCFKGMEKPLFLISNQYPGVWLEHVYDSIFYTTMYPQGAAVAKNTIEAFLDRQTKLGQFPCFIWDAGRTSAPARELVGYSQIQECVSFMGLCLKFCRMTGDRELLARCYAAGTRWVDWLKTHRMTRGTGLVEMFVGYDTGHDESGRLLGMACPGNYVLEGERMNAAVMPPEDGITPITPVDMNANYFGTLTALANMAEALGKPAEAEGWKTEAREHKTRFIAACYEPADGWFYDLDKFGRKRPCRSSTLLHLFLEHVLDPAADGDMVERIYREHIKNPREFWTPYPFPAMAADDPTARVHKPKNSWGYFSQGLIALRCTLWMDDYGWGADFDRLCERWVEAWTDCYDRLKFGQELDPFTGEPSPSSEWYSSTMLFYLYAVKRLSSK